MRKARTVQEIIASFPAAIAVDLRELHCESPFGIVRPGERGYQPIYVNPDKFTLADLDEIVTRQFECRAPTDDEREAALNGSMFGWDCPAADPDVVARDDQADGAGPCA